MTEKYKQQLEKAGVNLEGALHRFMESEALYEKFLSKFLQDETFKHLEESISAGDIDNAFRNAHTMKGLVANLDLECLHNILIPMTGQLKEGNMNDINDKLYLLKLHYDKICNIIRENQ